jgi:hypothetical protein
MAERAGDPVALGRVTANRAVLARLADGAERSHDGAGPWSPDGWVMRTHPDLSEAIEKAAPDDLRLVHGVATLVDGADRIYAVGWGTGGVWLRVPSGPAFDDAVGGDATAVEGLAGWVVVDAWRVDLGQWVRASAALTRDLVPAEPDAADA